MLRSDSKSDQPGRDPAQKREVRAQPDQERRRDRARTTQNPRDEPILNEDLNPLRDARRQLAPLLHLTQMDRGEAALTQGRSQPVRRGHGVLDRQIDADSADRRNRMRRIADAEETWAVPLTQSVYCDREQLDVLPVA